MNRFDDFLNEDFDGETPDTESRILLEKLRDLEDAPPPADLTDRIMRRVQAGKPPEKSGVIPVFRRWAPVAAAVILILGATPVLLGQFGPDQPELAERLPEQNAAEDPVTVAVAPENPLPGTYVPPEKVAAYFEQWDADLVNEMETYAGQAPDETTALMAALPEDSLGYGYYESPYEDPLSALVGF